MVDHKVCKYLMHFPYLKFNICCDVYIFNDLKTSMDVF
jgi:hypothetical protein